MQLIVQLRPDVAAEIHTQPECSAAAKAVQEAVKGTGRKLIAQHPGTSYATLLTYFQVETADRQSAELLQQRLVACDGVEAAYVKPPDEMP